MKHIFQIGIAGHRIDEYYNEPESIWEYYFDNHYAFGVENRFTVDELINLYRNRYFDPILDSILDERLNQDNM